ncbi:hypothetical protein B0O99DRAFT_696512 [Bisporella sp. PMI_857]|nr:hypothetical protein B0O99DRAFT_696512 [Bisporella sp. PMI_857]
MLPALPLLWLLVTYLARVQATVVATASIGNQSAGKSSSFVSQTAYATLFGVRWDGDKVRGIGLKLSDGTHSGKMPPIAPCTPKLGLRRRSNALLLVEVGDYGNNNYALTQFSFLPGETLVNAYLRDSGYGYRSLRQVQFTTSKGRSFFAGPSGFDNEVSLNVNGSFIAGFQAWVNNDNFINAFLFMVNVPAPPPAPQPVPWFETEIIGNQGAAKTQVQFASNTSAARYFAVRWDGDKVRGMFLTFFCPF